MAFDNGAVKVESFQRVDADGNPKTWVNAKNGKAYNVMGYAVMYAGKPIFEFDAQNAKAQSNAYIEGLSDGAALAAGETLAKRLASEVWDRNGDRVSKAEYDKLASENEALRKLLAEAQALNQKLASAAGRAPSAVTKTRAA